MIGPALPEPEVKLRIRWSCGLARCLHETRAGAKFHGMVMKQGLPQIVLQQPRESNQVELFVKRGGAGNRARGFGQDTAVALLETASQGVKQSSTG